MRFAPNFRNATTATVEPIDTPARGEVFLQGIGGGDAADERFDNDTHDDVIGRAGHDLTDCRTDALAHGLHVREKAIVARLDRAFFNR